MFRKKKNLKLQKTISNYLFRDKTTVKKPIKVSTLKPSTIVTDECAVCPYCDAILKNITTHTNHIRNCKKSIGPTVLKQKVNLLM